MKCEFSICDSRDCSDKQQQQSTSGTIEARCRNVLIFNSQYWWYLQTIENINKNIISNVDKHKELLSKIISLRREEFL